MNDFTKEELQEISDLIHFDIAEYGQQSSKSVNILIPLACKIQSMIDNYCEHEFYMVGCGHTASAQCNKCGQLATLKEFK